MKWDWDIGQIIFPGQLRTPTDISLNSFTDFIFEIWNIRKNVPYAYKFSITIHYIVYSWSLGRNTWQGNKGKVSSYN